MCHPSLLELKDKLTAAIDEALENVPESEVHRVPFLCLCLAFRMNQKLLGISDSDAVDNEAACKAVEMHQEIRKFFCQYRPLQN